MLIFATENHSIETQYYKFSELVLGFWHFFSNVTEFKSFDVSISSSKKDSNSI